MKIINFFKRKKLKKIKLIMTLLVRDEVDIIRENIEFHLKNGVDFIIATDNGSIDGTRDVLLEYEKRGILRLIDEPNQDYFQYKWVNRMGKMAIEEYKADIIFHCDADEFWKPRNGNLKTEIIKAKEDVLIVNLINVILRDRGGLESFPEDSVYAVTSTKIAQDLIKESEEENLYLFKYPPKVMLKTSKGLIEVTQGNHSISDNSNNRILQKESQNIIIYHFPVRSKNHFFTKVINGGKSMESNKIFDKGIGFHWRRWFDHYKKGTLENDYKKLIFSEDQAKILLENKTISKFYYNDIL